VPTDGFASLSYDTNTNHITNAAFQYDAAGNQTRAQAEDGSWLRYEYDTANRLSLVRRDSDNAPLQAYQYSASNGRLMNYDYLSGEFILYANDGGTTLSEYHEYTANTPTWTKSYVYFGDGLLSTVTPNGVGGETTDFDHPDRLGARVFTNQQSGTNSEQATLPFGTALNAESTNTTNKNRFTSYDRSTRTGLDYAVNRNYDSKQGRFTQVDPIRMSASSLGSPQTLNLYTYCGNDPINHTDPSGLFWGAIGRFFKKAWKWIAIAVVVALVVVAIVASQGTAAPEFLHTLGSLFSKLGIAHFIAGEGFGFSLGATGIGLIAVAGVGAITNQFTSKPGPKTRAFCNDLEGIINKIRPIINQVWNASDYGTPNAREQGGLISYSTARGWFGKAYPGSPGDSNVTVNWGVWIDNQLNSPRGTYDRPGVTNVFLIHSHPFDTGKLIKIKGGDHNGETGHSPNVEKPSLPGKPGDQSVLPPSLIGIIVTKGAINIYTRVGRRCTFRR